MYSYRDAILPSYMEIINARYKKPIANQYPKTDGWNQNQCPLGKEKHLQIYNAPILGSMLVFVGVMEYQNGFCCGCSGLNIARPHIPQRKW